MSSIAIPDALCEAVTIKLTKREIQVLTLSLEGRSYRQVANVLCISPKTVSFHLDNIYEKLHVKNLLQAIVRAIRLGLILSASDGKDESIRGGSV